MQHTSHLACAVNHIGTFAMNAALMAGMYLYLSQHDDASQLCGKEFDL